MLLTASSPRFVCKDRHLMQTESRMHMTMNRLQCDIQLRGCQPGHMLPEHPKTVWPVAEDTVRSADVSAWKSGTPFAPGGSQQDHVDHNTSVLTTRTLQGAVLDLAVVPSDSKPRVVVSALENAVLPDDRVVCALGSRGQRIAGVARRPVVVVSISSRRRAGHVPSPDEVRGRGLASRFSRLQDAPSACQQVQRVFPFGGLGRGRLNCFEANGNQ